MEYSSHAARSHTSTRLIAPTTTQSLVSPAYDRSCVGIGTLPYLSGVSSDAPAASIRWKSRTCLTLVGAALIDLVISMNVAWG